MRAPERFKTDERGATAVLFGLALVPLMLFAGAAVDYGRATSARTELQVALDATALALVREAGRLSDAQLEARGRDILKGLFRPDVGAASPTVQVQRGRDTIRVAAQSSVTTTLMAVAGVPVMEIAGQAQAAWGNRTIELALVLDNTGSMARLNKMPELKKAAHLLLDALDRAASGGDRVSVSVVPFDTQVRLDPADRNASWLRPLAASDLGNACDSRQRIDGTGALLPQNGRDPERTAREAWSGYVIDRDRVDCRSGRPGRIVDMNQKADAPDGLHPSTLYPMVRRDGHVDLPRIQPLTRQLGRNAPIRGTIDAMQPRGCTNITIGAMWGLETLSPAAPFTEAQPFGTRNVEKIMILLTDGKNTRDSFKTVCSEREGDPEIDARTKGACDVVKANGVTVFTIKVIEGSDDLLGGCASRITDPANPYYRSAGGPALYYPVNDASQLTGVFQGIVNQILQTRLTH